VSAMVATASSLLDLTEYSNCMRCSCGTTWRFSDVVSYIPARANLSHAVIEFGAQPHTQLSLDYVSERACSFNRLWVT